MRNKVITICPLPYLNQLLEDALYSFQATLTAYATLEDAQKAISEGEYSLIIMDASALAQECALANVERMRLATYAPLLVVASGEASALLLKAGADICIPERVPQEAVVSHALALLRRYTIYDHYDKKQPDKKPLLRGDIFIDPDQYTVYVRGHPVPLRLREFSLLHYFMRNPRRVLTPAQICVGAWELEGGYGGDVSGPIAILRRAIEPTPQAPIYIETVQQVGYRFTAHFSETCDD